MTEAKPWYQSRTIIGGAVAVAAGILQICGVEIGDLVPTLTDQIIGIASLIGGVMAIYGRWRARKPIA